MPYYHNGHIYHNVGNTSTRSPQSALRRRKCIHTSKLHADEIQNNTLQCSNAWKISNTAEEPVYLQPRRKYCNVNLSRRKSTTNKIDSSPEKYFGNWGRKPGVKIQHPRLPGQRWYPEGRGGSGRAGPHSGDGGDSMPRDRAVVWRMDRAMGLWGTCRGVCVIAGEGVLRTRHGRASARVRIRGVRRQAPIPQTPKKTGGTRKLPGYELRNWALFEGGNQGCKNKRHNDCIPLIN